MPSTPNRPVFLNLLRISMPVGAWASLLHRIAGILLVTALPLALYLFDLSLRGAAGYTSATSWLQSGPARLLGVLLVWSMAHHLCAGVRLLLLDLHVGARLEQARASAWAALLGAVVLTLLFASSLS